jgi:hypothetical protein
MSQSNIQIKNCPSTEIYKHELQTTENKMGYLHLQKQNSKTTKLFQDKTKNNVLHRKHSNICTKLIMIMECHIQKSYCQKYHVPHRNIHKFTFRNIEFSDFIHRPGIKKQTKGNTKFRKLDLFPSSGAGKNLFCWVP